MGFPLQFFTADVSASERIRHYARSYDYFHKKRPTFNNILLPFPKTFLGLLYEVLKLHKKTKNLPLSVYCYNLLFRIYELLKTIGYVAFGNIVLVGR